MPTETFTSATDWTVPDGVFALTATLEGEAGRSGYASGGNGGRVEGTITVVPGDTIYVRPSVGGGAHGGGDAADIRRGGNTLADRIAVAAGGGGAGRAEAAEDFPAAGGDGGADTGETGDHGRSRGGQGGSQTSGGSGGSGDPDGEDGSFGSGGAGGYESSYYGGGGGGGYYGGGGGGGDENSGISSANAGGGGGGSNYDGGLDTVSANERGTSPRSHGDGGAVTLEYDTAQPSGLSITDTTATTNVLSWDPLTDDGFEVREYRILRDTDSGSTAGDYAQIATVGSGQTTFEDTSLAHGERYYYRVTAELEVDQQ